MDDQKKNSFTLDADVAGQQQSAAVGLKSADIESFAALGLGPGGVARTIDIPGDYVDQADSNLVSWEPQVYRSVGGGTAVAPSMTSMFSSGGLDDSFGGLGGVGGLSPWSMQQQQPQQPVLQLKQQPPLATISSQASKVEIVIKEAPVRKVEWINQTWSLTTEGASKKATPRILYDLARSILSDGVDGMTVDYTEESSWSLTCTLYRNYEQTEVVVQVLEFQGHLHLEALLQKGNRLDFLKAFRQFSAKMQTSEYLPGRVPGQDDFEIDHLSPDSLSLTDLLDDLDDDLADLADLGDLAPPSLSGSSNSSSSSATEQKAADTKDGKQLQASLENLVELIRSPFLDVQEQGFQALAQISSQKDEAAAKIIFELAADQLVQGLKNESPSIQLAAASTLANLCEGKAPVSSAIAQKGACQESVKLADTKAQLHLVREVMRLMSSLAGCLGSQLVEHCQDLAPLIRRLRYQPPLDSLTRKHADTLAVRVSKSVAVA